jgi:hypothetical protein
VSLFFFFFFQGTAKGEKILSRKNARSNLRITKTKKFGSEKRKKNFQLFGAPVPKADDDCVKSSKIIGGCKKYDAYRFM